MNEEKKEQTLGMTRELKFKEIQEAIDQEENGKKKDISKKMTKKNVEEKEIVITKIQPLNDGLTEEEYYLTQSFKPVKRTKKIKKGFLNFFLIICILSLLSLGAFFFLYPFANKYFLKTPKDVFYAAIDTLAEELKIKVDDNLRSSIYFNSIFKMDTNIKEYAGFTDYEYITTFGVDVNEKKDLFTFSIKDKEDTYGLQVVHNENGSFLNFTNNSTFYDITDEEDERDLNEIKDLVKQSFFEMDAYNTLIEKESYYLKELLNEKNLSKKKDELTAFGQKKKVIRYTFKLEANDISSFIENQKRFMLQDDVYLQALSTYFEVEVEELKEHINKQREKSLQSFACNLYFQNGNEFVGFDMEVDGFRSFYYYNYDDQFIFYIDLNQMDGLFEEKTTEEKEEKAEEKKELGILEIRGKKEESLKAEIVYNEKKMASLDIRTFSSNKLDLSITLLEENRTIDLFWAEEDTKGQIIYTTKKDDKYLKFLMDYSVTNSANFVPVSEDFIKPYDEEAVLEELEQYLENIPDIVLSLNEVFNQIFPEEEPLLEEPRPVIPSEGETNQIKEDTIL